MNTRVLVVEDEAALSEPLAFLLEKEDFDVTVVEDGARAVEVFRAGHFDIVLLDVMLPTMPGTDVCQEIRKCSNVPILMVTAKDAEIDVVVGLELGADDYITKPYSTRELIARMWAVMRRTNLDVGASPDGCIVIAGIELDPHRHVLTVRGEEITIPLREFELLELLMRHEGKVLTRHQIIERIWGVNYVGDTKTLDVHIKRLRSRIEENPSDPALITTVRGLGYRFH